MHRKKLKIPCSFDVDYTHIIKHIPCSIQLTDVNNVEKEGVFNIQPLCKGYIKIEDTNIANAVITFYKPNIKQPNTIDYDTNHYTDGINGVKNWHWNNTFEIHSENYIIDKVKSDSNGFYTAFVKNGTYDILVQYNGNSELLKNIEITDGIEDEFYYYINGLISKKLNSTYIMVNEYARNINMSLINQYMNLTDGELIITQKDKLVVYKKIKENTLFALEPGVYDIRIRNDDTQLLFIKDFEFGIEDDFVDNLNKLIVNQTEFIKEEKKEEIVENKLENDETIKP